MGLRAKFNLLMLLPLLLGMALAAGFSWPLVYRQARTAALQDAAIMMAGASAISAYTDREIAPLLETQLKTRFLPQSIPFWAAQNNFRSVTAEFPNYTFKEAALNPTNPADRATDWETDIIEAFRRDPKRADLVTERATPDGPVLSYARPIRVSDAACLRCHSTPAAAPPPMIDLYGSNNGFGWKLNEVVGAAIVSVPMQVALADGLRTFEFLLAGLAAVFLVVYLAMNLLLHFVVLRPIRRLSTVADEVSLGNLDVPEYKPRGRDEIASLAQSFNRMRRSVANALRLLDR
jgi:HAMP domain-containing protein